MAEPKAYSNTIFSVTTQPDLAMSEIYMDDIGYNHLMLGHRDMANFIKTGLQTVVESPTHVYLSRSMINRLVFKSENVTTKSGKPMAVIVEREEQRGRVITATPHTSGPSGELVWESTGTIYSNYDKRSDLLYISKGTARDAYAEDEADGRLWLRKAEGDNSPVGVTIFEVKSYWRDHLSDLISQVARFLSVMPGEIELRVHVAIGS